MIGLYLRGDLRDADGHMGQHWWLDSSSSSSSVPVGQQETPVPQGHISHLIQSFLDFSAVDAMLFLEMQVLSRNCFLSSTLIHFLGL